MLLHRHYDDRLCRNSYKLTEYGRVYKGQYKVNVDNKLNYVNQKCYLHNYYKYCYGVNDYGY